MLTVSETGLMKTGCSGCTSVIMTNKEWFGMESTRHTPLIMMAGNVAAGKSTLASALAKQLGWAYSEESVRDNPFLERFYADTSSWAFHLNMFFLASRSQEILRARERQIPTVFDRSIYEDRLFVQINFEDGATPPENYRVFTDLQDVLETLLPPPSVLVHVHAPVDELLQRVRARDRPYELGISRDYLTRLEEKYDSWLSTYDLSPILRVDTTKANLSTDEASIRALGREILSAANPC
jgi:deoxyadenosine/deoxycytidine kinase